MDVDALGTRDPERHEGPRTAVVLAVAALLGLLAVGGVFWLVTAGLGGSSGGGAVAAPAAVSTSDETTSAPEDSPTTIASTLTSTSRTTTPSPTLDLPPPEQPTYTLPATAVVTSTAVPGSGPSSPGSPAPPPTTAPAQARVTDARLSCRRTKGNVVKGTLTFTTTSPVQAYLVGGGKVVSGVRGPGDVTMTVNGGDGAGYCLATVGGQTLGPVPAR